MSATSNPSFGKTTTALEVASIFPESIRGRTILITGVNKAGLGYATAQAFLSQSPRHLILAGRSQSKVEECIDALREEFPTQCSTGGTDLRPLIVDLSSQRSVRNAATTVMDEWRDIEAIHLIVNNAGVMRHGDSLENAKLSSIPLSEDGIEDMFAVNHIGHFLLTNLIMPKILAAADATSSRGSVRIVNLASSGTYVSPLRVSDLAWQKQTSELPASEKPNFALMKMAGMIVDEETSTYIPTAAYGNSKTCNILFAVGLNRKLFDQHSVLSLAVNPGEIKTELMRNTDPEWLKRALSKREGMGIQWKTQAQGAATTLVAACDPKLSLPESDGTGQYLNDCQFGKAPAYATDEKIAEKLWEISEQLTNQNFVY